MSEWFSKNVRHYLNISQNFYKKQMSSINKSQYIAGITNLLQELFTYSFLIVRVLQNDKYRGLYDVLICNKQLQQFNE